MKYIISLALASLATAATLPLRRSVDVAAGKLPAKALYSITNQESGNQIRALPLASDGTIASAGTLTSTGGKGIRAPGPGVTDSLNSDGSITRVGNLIYAVNPGSNTVSILRINPKNYTELTLVGSPVDTIGDFPMSVAVHPQTKQACVATSGAKSGLTCYAVASDGTLSGGVFKPLSLSPQQTTPPHGSGNALSSVRFSRDGSAVYVTVKGEFKPTGYWATFFLNKGFAASSAIKTNVTDTLKLFGFIDMPRKKDEIFYTDPSFGAGVLRVNSDGTATALSHTDIPNQGSTCWAAWSSMTDYIYTTDDGANQVAAFDSTTGKLVTISHLTNGNPQMFQLVSQGDKLYALSEGNSTYPQHVIVMQTGPKGTVTGLQNFQVEPDFNLDGLVAHV